MSDMAIDLTRYIPAAEASVFPSKGIAQFTYGPEQKILQLNPFFSMGLALFVSNVDPFTLKPIERYEGERQQVNVPGVGMVDMSPWLNYALGNTFRAYREYQRGDLSRFLGARTVKDDYPTQLFYERRGLDREIDPWLFAIKDTSGKYSEGERDLNRQKLIENRAQLIANLAETYAINDQGKGQGAFQPFSKNADVSRYGLLDKMSNAIVAGERSGGIIATIGASTTLTPEQKHDQIQKWWRSWFEIEQTKLSYLGAYIGTIPRTGIYQTEKKGPGATDVYQQQLDDAYSAMRSEIRGAIMQPDIGPLTFTAFRNAYRDVLEHQVWDRPRTRGMTRGGDWIRSGMREFDQLNPTLYEQMRQLEASGISQ
jgi:hypothetical protein